MALRNLVEVECAFSRMNNNWCVGWTKGYTELDKGRVDGLLGNKGSGMG